MGSESEPAPMSDKDLVKRCQSDVAAFEEIVRRYKRAVFAYARGAIGSTPDAEEVTQDVFIKVYRAAHRFNPKYSFKTWLYTIASNTCKNMLRSRARHRRNISLDNEDSPLVTVSRESTPLEAYEQGIEVEAVRDAIDSLPPRYKQVLHLRYVEGLRYREIGKALGLSLGNVEARIFRGKERVRQRLLRNLGKGGGAGEPAREN